MTSNDLAIASYFNSGYGCDTTDLTMKIGLQPGKPQVGCDAAHYWSFHSAGAQFLMADGSCRMITYSNNLFILAMSTRSGGEIANTQYPQEFSHANGTRYRCTRTWSGWTRRV